MKRIFKGISVLFISAVLLTVTAVTAFAASAKTGDSVEVTVSVEGEDSMGSTSIQISYDKDKFDLLSDETLEGTGLSNTEESGLILWADMFDPDGADFSKKTDVYKVILIAKQNISDVESLIGFTVNDAYKIGANGVERTDSSHLSCSVALESSNIVESTVTSKSDNNNNNNNTAKNPPSAQTDSKAVSNKSESAASKTAASNASSAASSKTSESSKVSESSSETVSRDSDKSSDSDTAEEKDTAAAAESTVSIIESYDEAEFESVPPIKLDAETSETDSRGAFPKGAVVGIAVCLVIAAAGIVTIVAKRKG